MYKVACALDERFVNPLFEVFDGGDLILSSFRDVEADKTVVQIFFEDAARTGEAKAALEAALEIVGAACAIESAEVPDEDWRFSYRKHFTTERIGARLVVHPPWEPMPLDGVVVTLDPYLPSLLWSVQAVYGRMRRYPCGRYAFRDAEGSSGLRGRHRRSEKTFAGNRGGLEDLEK